MKKIFVCLGLSLIASPAFVERFKKDGDDKLDRFAWETNENPFIPKGYIANLKEQMSKPDHQFRNEMLGKWVNE